MLNVAHPSGERRHGANPPPNCVVMDHSAFGAILGVSNTNRRTVRHQQGGGSRRVWYQLTPPPQTNITPPEGNGTFWFGRRRCRVFPHSEKVEKRNDDQVRRGVKVGVPTIVRSNSRESRDGNGKFRFRRRILVAVLLQESGNGEVKRLLSGGGSSGVSMSVQNKPLGDVAESPLD